MKTPAEVYAAQLEDEARRILARAPSCTVPDALALAAAAIDRQRRVPKQRPVAAVGDVLASVLPPARSPR